MPTGKTRQELAALRLKLDGVYSRLFLLLASRMELIEKIGKLKARHGIPARDKRREKTVLDNCRAKLQKAGFEGKMTNGVLRDLKVLMASSRKFQQKGKMS